MNKTSIHNGVGWKSRSETYKKEAVKKMIEAGINHDGQSNREFSQNESFQLACLEVGIKPTKRQASKYRRGIGSAYKGKKDA